VASEKRRSVRNRRISLPGTCCSWFREDFRNTSYRMVLTPRSKYLVRFHVGLTTLWAFMWNVTKVDIGPGACFLLYVCTGQNFRISPDLARARNLFSCIFLVPNISPTSFHFSSTEAPSVCSLPRLFHWIISLNT
jgi:hypothetical protein